LSGGLGCRHRSSVISDHDQRARSDCSGNPSDMLRLWTFLCFFSITLLLSDLFSFDFSSSLSLSSLRFPFRHILAHRFDNKFRLATLGSSNCTVYKHVAFFPVLHCIARKSSSSFLRTFFLSLFSAFCSSSSVDHGTLSLVHSFSFSISRPVLIKQCINVNRVSLLKLWMCVLKTVYLARGYDGWYTYMMLPSASAIDVDLEY
jgi:hypothetical protein